MSSSEPNIVMTESQVKELASEIAEETVRKLFLGLGVDISSPEGILNAQQDFQHLRAWRNSVETVKQQGIISAIGVITVGVLAVLWSRVGGHTSP